ncbi:MAG: hypothetical protein IJU44_08020 [Kiritimatiellae bacterium]|jgi:hypothetical protein|nr:hypothetical protein [Kiritimatiellia bacterium]
MDFPIFEAAMMLCFGLAWPASLLKSWRSRTNKGKSLSFLIIVAVGYASGLTHKLCWQQKVDGVVWLYIANATMVALDICFYIRNHFIDLKRDKGDLS